MELHFSFQSSQYCGIMKMITAFYDHYPMLYEDLILILHGYGNFWKQAKIGKLTHNVVERARTDSSLMVPTDTHIKERSPEEREQNSKQQEVPALIASKGETSEIGKDENKGQIVASPKAAEGEKIAAGSPAEAEEKAAKIQRLKSGFRICKPQGTFLWPNMVKDNNSINSSSTKVMSPQVVVQVEVPTPPSVSSSTAPQLPYHHHYQPASIVKPLAEKRAVTVTVSTLSKAPNYEDGANNYSTTTALVNLNDAPSNLNAMPLVSNIYYFLAIFLKFKLK